MDEFFKDLKLELSKNGDVDLLPLRAEDRFVVIQNNPLRVSGEHPLRGKKTAPPLKEANGYLVAGGLQIDSSVTVW